MSRYVYVLEYSNSPTPNLRFGSPVMTSRDYHEIRSECRKISRQNNSEGECYIYRVKCEKDEFFTQFVSDTQLVKENDIWSMGTITFDYIGRYCHERETDRNSEFYADWTLGRDAQTRHSMYVVTPRKCGE